MFARDGVLFPQYFLLRLLSSQLFSHLLGFACENYCEWLLCSTDRLFLIGTFLYKKEQWVWVRTREVRVVLVTCVY